jgi:hypothetical protein
MAKATLDVVLEEVKALTPDEQRWLRKVLDEVLAEQEEATKLDVFHQALLAAGLVKTIRTPRATATADRKLIQVRGKPLSETIIEERR